MKKIFLLLTLLFSLLQADLFVQGNKTVGISLGSGSVNYGWPRGSEYYTILGVSGDYFIVDDLSVGLAYRHWFGTPSIDEVTLPVTYYLPLDANMRPYAGLFYRRVFMGSGYDDGDVYGGRAGVTIKVSPRSYLGVGWVQEYWDGCSDRSDCSSGYPEAVFSFSF